MTARVMIVMGVSGVGKTTVGQALAKELDAEFSEGDRFHPVENIAKMRNGIPLTDDDRSPWLDRLNTEIGRWLATERRVVLACSALKQSYRDRLIGAHRPVDLVYLKGERARIKARLADRRGHYMPASLLASQFEALEEPPNAITIDADRPLAEIIADLGNRLNPSWTIQVHC